MPSLSADQFPAFFREIHGYAPFPWQTELANRACLGDWPGYIAVPTGSGKTATIDIAIFALAVQATLKPEERTVGRRIFYIVNRRIIVDEAFERAQKIAATLCSPTDAQPAVKFVADALRSIGANITAPIECAQLRGGIYRDQSWANSVIQPLVVTATVDQVGSRLLFRGYGVSPSSWPIHAALVANDSLLLLDEAHISRPFAQTLEAFKRYRELGAGEPNPSNTRAHFSPKTPFAFVQMTATPPANTDEKRVLRLDGKDLENTILKSRVKAGKPAVLVVAEKASGKNAIAELATKLSVETERMLNAKSGMNTIAVLVNRVATAKAVYEKLIEKFDRECVSLLIGRMRPFDRDDVTRDLSNELRTKVTGTSGTTHSSNLQEKDPAVVLPRIVVATQCLEVGADFDFDALVTECASLDSLRQRFGRLNRAGRPIDAQAAIVIRADQIFADEAKLADPKNNDPIYVTALSRTWNWLKSVAINDTVDFGIEAMDSCVTAIRATNETCFSELLSPTQDAPLLLPAHLDIWCQTSPEPTPQPEPALFLHGPQSTDADIQVCWRADLGDDISLWPDILSLCPPSVIECLPVPISQFRHWIQGETTVDTGDVLDVATSDVSRKMKLLIVPTLIWRGPDNSVQLKTSDDLHALRPGDTLILASATPDLDELGHFPSICTGIVSDQAARAWIATKHRNLLRLSPVLLNAIGNFKNQLGGDSPLATLLNFAESADNDIPIRDFSIILHAAAHEAVRNSDTPDALREAMEDFAAKPEKIFRVMRYPHEIGLVIQTVAAHTSIPEDDTGDDSTSDATAPVLLKKHLVDVRQALEIILEQLPLGRWMDDLTCAAFMHDWGKADERFLALLLGGNINLAWAQTAPLAKSARMPTTAAAYEIARKRATLPKYFRHELLSLQLAEKMDVGELTLHLIATHHGYARPFAPVVLDENPPDVSITYSDKTITLSSCERVANQSHRLDSGVAERFWRLTRRFGWWNLAYLETVLRLVDRQVSASYQRSGD